MLLIPLIAILNFFLIHLSDVEALNKICYYILNNHTENKIDHLKEFEIHIH